MNTGKGPERGQKLSMREQSHTTANNNKTYTTRNAWKLWDKSDSAKQAHEKKKNKNSDSTQNTKWKMHQIIWRKARNQTVLNLKSKNRVIRLGSMCSASTRSLVRIE